MGGLVQLARGLGWPVLRGVEVVEDGLPPGLRPDDLYITHYNNSHQRFYILLHKQSPSPLEPVPSRQLSCVYSDACFIAKLNKSLNIILILTSDVQLPEDHRRVLADRLPRGRPPERVLDQQRAGQDRAGQHEPGRVQPRGGAGAVRADREGQRQHRAAAGLHKHHPQCAFGARQAYQGVREEVGCGQSGGEEGACREYPAVLRGLSAAEHALPYYGHEVFAAGRVRAGQEQLQQVQGQERHLRGLALGQGGKRQSEAGPHPDPRLLPAGDHVRVRAAPLPEPPRLRAGPLHLLPQLLRQVHCQGLAGRAGSGRALRPRLAHRRSQPLLEQQRTDAALHAPARLPQDCLPLHSYPHGRKGCDRAAAVSLQEQRRPDPQVRAPAEPPLRPRRHLRSQPHRQDHRAESASPQQCIFLTQYENH